MKGSNLLFLASWVILLVVSGAIVLLSVQSLRIAGGIVRNQMIEPRLPAQNSHDEFMTE